MKEIQEKVKELKFKVLEIIENKLEGDVQLYEMRALIECLNTISGDKNWYLDALNAGFAGIGFGSIVKPPVNNSQEANSGVAECEK